MREVERDERAEAGEVARADARDQVLLRVQAAEHREVREVLELREPVRLEPQALEVGVRLEVLDLAVALVVQVQLVVELGRLVALRARGRARRGERARDERRRAARASLEGRAQEPSGVMRGMPSVAVVLLRLRKRAEKASSAAGRRAARRGERARSARLGASRRLVDDEVDLSTVILHGWWAWRAQCVWWAAGPAESLAFDGLSNGQTGRVAKPYGNLPRPRALLLQCCTAA